MSEHGVVYSADRREFLAVGTAAAAASLLAPGGVFAAAKSDVIKVGLIGCGGRGTGAAKDCLMADPGIKLVAVGDAFANKAAGAVATLKKVKTISDRVDVNPELVFSGLDAYQKVIDSGVDLVILATPPGFRPYHLEAAIKADKHVFTEKPVAVDGPGIRKCLEVYEEANKKKKVIVAGTQRRHQKGYIETIAKLHDGAIGDIVSARCYWNNDGIWFRKREQGQTDVQYQINNWYHFNWLCGDHIVEQHVHNLDVINWIMKGHPIRATGMGGRTHRPVGTPEETGNIFDHFAVEYEYANGVRLFSFCRHQQGCWNSVSEAVAGSKGTSQVDQYKINGVKAGSDEGAAGAYQQEHIDMIRAIRAGTHINELKTVTESTMTAILGRMSTYTGKSLTWEEGLNSKELTMPANLAWDTKLVTPPPSIPGKTKFI